tara:strand:+ start:77 stop:367 length:291 start_codon:yes stop_codon:yes gene_type:complete
MKSLIIIFNILFLSFGNILLANIHHIDHHHDHEYSDYEVQDCPECEIIKNNNNYVSTIFFDDVFVINSIQLQIFQSSAPDLTVSKRFNSRAPPTSK